MPATLTPKGRPRTGPRPTVTDSPLLKELKERHDRIEVLRSATESSRLELAEHLHQIDQKQLYRLWSYTSVSDYAFKEHGFSSGETTEMKRVGKASDEIPEFRQAMQQRRINYSVAREVAKSVKQDNVKTLLSAIDGMTTSQVKAFLSGRERLHTRTVELNDQELVVWDEYLQAARGKHGTKVRPGWAVVLGLSRALEAKAVGNANHRVLINLCYQCGMASRPSSIGPVEISTEQLEAAIEGVSGPTLIESRS